MSDLTPDGEPIDTHTFWLPFPDADVAISADVTKFNAAMADIRRSVARRQPVTGNQKEQG